MDENHADQAMSPNASFTMADIVMCLISIDFSYRKNNVSVYCGKVRWSHREFLCLEYTRLSRFHAEAMYRVSIKSFPD